MKMHYCKFTVVSILGIIIFLDIPPSLCFAQKIQNKTVQYSYDANGNREHRWVTIEKNVNNESLDSIKEDSVINNKDGRSNQGRISIRLFPNPTRGILDLMIIGLNEGEIAEFSLFSLEGKQLFKKHTSSQLTHIDIGKIISGVYIVTVRACSEIIKWKIIKEQ